MLNFESMQWAQENFGGLSLGNIRRSIRIINFAGKMAAKPGKSIPQLSSNLYEVKAIYNCLGNEDLTPDALQSTHRILVHEKIETKDNSDDKQIILLIEDSSDICFNNREPINGIPKIGLGRGKVQSFLLHSTLAVAWNDKVEAKTSKHSKKPSVEILGLIDQQYRIRYPSVKNDDGKVIPRRFYKPAKHLEKESIVWEKTSSRITPLPQKNTRYIRIGDRGADIYEVLRDSQENNLGFVIRAAQDRKLANEYSKLFETAQAMPSLGTFSLELRSRPKMPARIANLAVSVKKIDIQAPRRSGYACKDLPNISCNIIRVWEPNPPQDIAPLEWYLLCDQEILTFDQAIKYVQMYACRWLVEDFHKALKSGVGAEKIQFEAVNKLFTTIAVMSIVALRLVDMRESFRIYGEKPAKDAGLSPLEIKVLSLRLKRKLSTVNDVNLALGRLGGHLNRKGDGLPGMITIWRGFMELQILVEGFKIGLQMASGITA